MKIEEKKEVEACHRGVTIRYQQSISKRIRIETQPLEREAYLVFQNFAQVLHLTTETLLKQEVSIGVGGLLPVPQQR